MPNTAWKIVHKDNTVEFYDGDVLALVVECRFHLGQSDFEVFVKDRCRVDCYDEEEGLLRPR